MSRALTAWFATCPRGVESLLAAELAALGAGEVRETVAGVHFSGTLSTAYRCCLWSRLANRLLWPLATVPAGDADALYRGLRALPWADYFGVAHSFAVEFSGTSGAIRNTQFGAQRCKDAVVDRFMEEEGRRPDVNRAEPDIRIHVRLARDEARVALDLSGHSLHRRGYRLRGGAAPLKENLAAALLLRADWPGMAARGGALIDPLCGSGTLLIEGAMMAADMAPGLLRERFGFEGLRLHDAQVWRALQAEARGRAERGLAAALPEIRGYDADRRIVHVAEENIARAGLSRVVRVTCRALSALRRPTHRSLSTGLIVTNPPYGERLGEREELAGLYRELGERMAAEFGDWRAAVFTSDLDLARAIGLRSHKRYALFNGAIASHLLLFDLQGNVLRQPRPGSADAPEAALGEGARMFANRLAKNRRRLAPWLRRESIECYRIYDADIPEYAVAVDVYGEYAHVAEYQAPASVPEVTAAHRLEEVRAALPGALGIAPARIVFKQRRRQRGAQQYARQGRRGERILVREGAARLLVNLHDYLDTGLFLDHRPLRRRLAAESAGRDFLNLFCYTGSATVHAALGGARSTTSVDTSRTYLAWLEDNLDANGLRGGPHRVIREDCAAWLARAQDSFDLILLDPPSFSNSKSRAASFDVQRDHPALVRAAMARLRPGGWLYFSNNRRGFQIDASLEAEFAIRDLTSATIDPDFARSPRIHGCWRLEHLQPA